MVKNQWSCFPKLFCVSELGNTKFQLPENIVLPLSETALPHVYVGDEAYRLTAYITKRTAEYQTERNNIYLQTFACTASCRK